jgi:hypothetical protein
MRIICHTTEQGFACCVVLPTATGLEHFSTVLKRKTRQNVVSRRHRHYLLLKKYRQVDGWWHEQLVN